MIHISTKNGRTIVESDAINSQGFSVQGEHAWKLSVPAEVEIPPQDTWLGPDALYFYLIDRGAKVIEKRREIA
jgi:hypothetical protein